MLINKDKFSIVGQLKALAVASFFTFIFTITNIDGAAAQESANTIAGNVITSTTDLPGLISALSYMLGIVAGVMGILKLRAHVENPGNAPLNQAVIRIALAGALFALPIIYESALNTFNPGGAAVGGVELQGELDEIGNQVGGGGNGGNTELNDLALNVVESTNQLPALISGLAYLLGLLLGVLGLIKFKESIDFGSSQATVAAQSLRAGIIRVLAAGALFALPAIYEAVDMTISGGNNELSFDNDSIANDVSSFLGTISGIVPTMNFNNILSNIIDASNQLPALISAVAYLLGLTITISGILKIKDHVENPDNTPMKEGIIRLVVAGALFALPSVYNAMFTTVGGDGLGIIGNITSLFAGAGFLFSSYAGTLCNPVASTIGGIGGAVGAATGGLVSFGGGVTAGDTLCGILTHTGAFPAFLSAVAYLIGLIFGLWGIFKIRDHVLNPQQTGIWEGVSRFIAGGLFFALPVVVEVARNTLTPGALTGLAQQPVTQYYGGGGGGIIGAVLGLFGGGGNGGASAGLDGMLINFMGDMMGPMHVVLNFFAFCAGMILLMIGTSRLIKSAQDGARGPGGLGTIMTFVVGAGLISYNELVRAFSTTFTSSPVTFTNAKMSYTQGMTGAEVDAAHYVITAIIQFMIVVGLISFVRGLFIVRGVAEGNSQSSIMAGLTHIVGGALAVNLGPVINAVQSTLGIAQYGIAFS